MITAFHITIGEANGNYNLIIKHFRDPFLFTIFNCTHFDNVKFIINYITAKFRSVAMFFFGGGDLMFIQNLYTDLTALDKSLVPMVKLWLPNREM